MAAFIDPVLRGLLFVWLLIALGLTGSLAATSNHQNPQVNFGVFAAAFGLLFGSIYGIAAAFIEFLAFPIIIAIFDFLNFVFLFAAATAIAAAIRVHSCSNQKYLDSNTITQGSDMRCREAQSSVAFLYFGFFTIVALLVYDVIQVMNHGAFSMPSSRRRKTAGRPAGVPTMSQV
jgi:hypothetical protein